MAADQGKQADLVNARSRARRSSRSSGLAQIIANIAVGEVVNRSSRGPCEAALGDDVGERRQGADPATAEPISEAALDDTMTLGRLSRRSMQITELLDYDENTAYRVRRDSSRGDHSV